MKDKILNALMIIILVVLAINIATEEPTTEEPTTVPETKYYIAGDEGLVGG